MESQDDKPSIPKSSSFSPKVTRPKLPPFAGSGPRSNSPRSKTDPGRVEIKAIMEDIMNLKKTDWKTFSRSRTAQNTRGKSVSASTSPTASPRIGSPVADESRAGLSRDRSRSLKVLTDRLKNKNSKQAVQEPPKGESSGGRNDMVVVSRTIELQPALNTSQQPAAQSISTFPKGASPRRSPDRRSMERMYEQIPETLEEVEQEEGEGATSSRATSSEESFRSVPESQDELREKTPDSDCPALREQTPDSDDTSSIRSQEDLFKMKSLTEKPAGDDEGIVESGEQSAPVISTYIYHPIPRNSKFLQLAATKPPKRFPPERRSGITMVNTRARLGADLSPSGSAPDDQVRQRFQRRSDSGKSTAQKSSARFITHPPHMKTTHQEAGSMDTNGFTALKASSDADDELKQQSQLSLADSQFASEMSDDASYQDVVDSVVTDSGVDISDRKNGKSSKQKSKSDPSGDRARDMFDFPQGMEAAQFHSAPLLSKEELEAMGIEESMSLTDEDAKLRSRSETALAGPPQGEDDGDEHGFSSGGEDEYHVAAEALTVESDRAATLPLPKTPKPEATSAPGTPHGPSPSPGATLERPTTLLSVPQSSSGTGRKPNIFRSASSASVLQSRKPSSSSLREKEVARKYSITSDEAMVNAKSSANLVPDFLPIGDTPNATSMPAVWNKDRITSTDSPEREPGFRKATISTRLALKSQPIVFLPSQGVSRRSNFEI
ncbi:rho guanine nucleotide exchange factor 17-like [Plakobranchus ocellatus]|uniref:Rho guanine nucleotide exchange factor 17-like n=1 Tax=Plakobranchus ocellatus TaxID=259542 RepID=A0AAV4DUF3_9GAST|nr:rho guanine nucleotide exchange factor 17-like [Plakobranchus ocellatus]